MTDFMHIDHPEDERYDEINIKVVERWKESELSGDEWRFTYVAEIKRKGEIVITVTASKLNWLLQSLQWKILVAGESDVFDRQAWDRTKDKCDQPGCASKATAFFIRKKRYTLNGDELAPSSYYDGKEYRQFCGTHLHRGDCGLDDADHNYNMVSRLMIKGV